jgi:hypothetical protein
LKGTWSRRSTDAWIGNGIRAALLQLLTAGIGTKRPFFADECLLLVKKRSCSGHHRKDRF